MDWIIEIYKKSFGIVKKNRWLWVFGMVLVATSGASFSGNFQSFGNISSSFNQGSTTNSGAAPDFSIFTTVLSSIMNIFSQVPVSAYATLAISVVIAIILGMIISLVVISWAQGAAIGAINDGYNNKPVTLRSGSLYGIRSFKRVIWLMIVPGLLYFLAIIIPFIISLFVMIALWDSTLGRLIGILIFLIFLFIMILASLAISASIIWAKRITVIEGKGAYQSFKEGWVLVKTHFLKMIALGCSNCVLSCCLGITIAASIGAAIAAGIGLLSVNKQVGMILLATIGIIVLILLLLSLLFGGIYTIFNYTTWNILYRQVRSKK
ncbi:hypothetical protein HYT02_02285 [Candidatus Gottesmanbacteria bacterium]|nr:hypothetical protein [Candidatus Gottesmanbacteria bacterium]